MLKLCADVIDHEKTDQYHGGMNKHVVFPQFNLQKPLPVEKWGGHGQQDDCEKQDDQQQGHPTTSKPVMGIKEDRVFWQLQGNVWIFRHKRGKGQHHKKNGKDKYEKKINCLNTL